MRNLSFGFAHPLSIKTSSAAVLALFAVGVAACGSYGADEGAFDDAAQTLDEQGGPIGSAVSVGVSSSVGTGGFGTGGGGTGGDTGTGGSGTGGDTGTGGGEGGGVVDPPPVFGPPGVGFWKFDDCDSATTTLSDSSGNGNDATRSTGAACVAGISGPGVEFNHKNDTVTVGDDPSFTFGKNLAVAAWVKPTAVTGTQVIVQERGTGSSDTSFTLSIKNGSAQFAVRLSNSQTITSSAKIDANVWTHVGGIYDGRFVRLFLNGEQFGQISVPSAATVTLNDISAPIHIGHNPQNTNQRFKGLIDEVWLSASPSTGATIAELSCIKQPATIAVTPPTAGPVPANTPVSYDIAVTNNNVGACGNANYFLSIFGGAPGVNIFPDTTFVPEVASGSTAHFPVTVSGTEEAEPGVHEIPFQIDDFFVGEFIGSGSLSFESAAPTGCFVRTGRELFVKHLSVVEDPIRTTFDGPPEDPRTGAWTFAKLMEDMAPTPEAAPAMVEQLFDTWRTDQVVNGFTIPARPAIQNAVFDFWPRSPDGSLDLKQAPLRLLGIVNRIDVRNLAEGNAGEGRFVFNVVGGFEQQFTVILEYKLPASTEADVLQWANDWHALGNLPFPSEEYNAALQAITTRFAGRNAAPGKPNGSSLGQLRTNEISLAPVWELREFNLSPVTGFLEPTTVKLTPDLSFDGTATLADFVNQNEAAIVAEQHTVPETFQGAPFLAGAILNNLTAWRAPGIVNNEARHKFSLNTCNGCHGSEETGTGFLHVFPRPVGGEAQLSGFMTGITIGDPVTGEPRTLNDLGRRNADLKALVCEPAPTAVGEAEGAPGSRLAAPASRAASRSAFIRRGIGRVH
ncbi:LamG-like jellyroll fold domain-containing protein [Sorangium sp. So ce131]|uniref:LamG domain-containing protein n=1 Tax=Sorangium sp. So ce131 TaxID=3133282 RepID=UPI003F6087C0